MMRALAIVFAILLSTACGAAPHDHEHVESTQQAATAAPGHWRDLYVDLSLAREFWHYYLGLVVAADEYCQRYGRCIAIVAWDDAKGPPPPGVGHAFIRHDCGPKAVASARQNQQVTICSEHTSSTGTVRRINPLPTIARSCAEHDAPDAIEIFGLSEARHELGHYLGFRHAGGAGHVMAQGQACVHPSRQVWPAKQKTMRSVGDVWD